MQLTRRDAMAALAAAGVAVGLDSLDRFQRKVGAGDGDLTDRDFDVLVAVAEVVYPSEVSGVESFVREYAQGRAAGGDVTNPNHADSERADGIREAVETLDTYATEWHDSEFLDLDPGTRDSLLDSMGVDAADPDPDGADRERVRYYLVNDLLFALYASPTGGRLLGIENPPGYPGGTASYQRGSPDG